MVRQMANHCPPWQRLQLNLNTIYWPRLSLGISGDAKCGPLKTGNVVVLIFARTRFRIFFLCFSFDHSLSQRFCYTHTLPPFNDRKSQQIGAYVFGYNSPAAAARKVLKPSTYSASLVVPSQKLFFSFVFGVLLGGRHKWGCFRVFMAYFTWPWMPIEWAHILAQILLRNQAILRVFRALDWLSSISG